MTSLDRRHFLHGALGATALPLLDLSPIHAQGSGTLRIAMTASDIPLPNGQTDQGAEGMRFVGYNVFDSLVLWDLAKADAPGGLIPGLATSWTVDPADRTRWIFVLRPGVTFHDGSAFDAAAVVWNFDKILKNDAPQYDPRQAGQGRTRIPSVKSYRAVDPMTVEFVTNEPNALFPYEMSWILMSSPAQWEKTGRNWDNFLKSPSGTGPWKVDRYTPRERLELIPNAAYWNAARRPKLRRAPAALPPSSPARSTGSRRRPPTPSRSSARAACRSSPTSIRTTGRGISPGSRARPGTTSASARPPISPSTAPAWSNC
jgi:peptide/nickel transport system substrate-binding protein